ncbi:MAG TPA: tetratricopeptide repeat protein [Burkholderiales bacterium]|nr:tetratricopeptide repeat protein [Burkholderiales bacterium]
MSLLMKALQKAAQNREGGSQGAGEVTEKDSRELELQPMESESTAAAWAQPLAEPPAATVSPAMAATVMRAGETPGGIGNYIRGHPIVLIGLIAALLVIGGFVYVLLAINKPAVFTAPAQPSAKAPLVVAPAPQPAPPPAQPVPESKPLFADLPREQGEVNAVRAPRPAAPRALPQQNISVSPVRAAPTVDPQLQDAYSALQQNRLETAQAAYQKFLTAEPNNVEALLGLASIAEQQKQPDQATQYYMKALQTDPKNATAQAALIGLVGRADPQASEARLKQLLAREPSAFLYFTLGNLYAGQSQWPGAQDVYFRAHHLQSDNPDYAFNLAVSLEHLNQPKLALKFYQQALTLARNKGQAHFDLNLAQNRISRLSSLE